LKTPGSDILDRLVGNTLTVRVVAKEDLVPLDSLLRVLNETLAMLRVIDEEMSSRGHRTLRWRVSEVRYHSPLMMTIVGEPSGNDGFSIGVVTECLEGIGRLEKGEEPSPVFSELAMERAKKVASVRNDGISSVVFSAPDRQAVEPTQHLIANVDVILKRRFRAEHTTIDGTLLAINVHKGLTFHVYDLVTGQGTSCSFPDELFEEAVTAIRHRVAVTGVAKYNRAGRPVTMKVGALRRLRPSADLPHFRAGEEIPITGGLSSEEYVRRMRDAEERVRP